MKCKMCGTLMGDMDLFCKVCGAKNEKVDTHDTVLDEFSRQQEKSGKGTGTSVKKSTDENEFTWNVYEFPKPKKTEEIDIQWPTEDYRKSKRRELDDDEPLCWNLDNKPKKAAIEAEVKKEADVFFDSIESEFEVTKNNIISEYESVKNRKTVFEELPAEAVIKPEVKASAEPVMVEVDKQKVQMDEGLQEFGAGLPEGFYERVVLEGEDLPVQSFDDLPGGYPQRRRRAAQNNGGDTREATKKADRSIFRTDSMQQEDQSIPEIPAQKPLHNHNEALPGMEAGAALIAAAGEQILQRTSAPAKEPIVQKEASAASPENSGKESPVEDHGDDLGEMEKFFTFSKKSEEFQKLLDQEYEKIQKKNSHRPEVSDSRISGSISDTLNFTLMDEDRISALSDTQSGLKHHHEEASSMPELEASDGGMQRSELLQPQTLQSEYGKINTQQQSETASDTDEDRKTENKSHLLFAEQEHQTEEKEQYQEESDIFGEEESGTDYREPLDFIPRKDRRKKSIYPSAAYAREWEEEQKTNPGGRTGYMEEMAAARDSFFRNAAEDTLPSAFQTAGAQPEGAPGTMQTGGSTEVLVTVAVKSSGNQGTTTRQTISMSPVTGGDPIITTETSVDPTPVPETEVSKETIRIGDTTAIKKSIYPGRVKRTAGIYPEIEKSSGNTVYSQPDTKESPVRKEPSVSTAEEKAAADQEKDREQRQVNQKQPQAVSDNIRKDTDSLPFETIPEKDANDFWLNYSYEKDAGEKKFSGGRVALIVIAVLLFVEIGALSITFFLPDSKAASVVTNAQVKMVKGIEGITGSIAGLFSGDEKDSDSGSDKEKQDSTENQTAASTEPQPDKNILIQNALGENKNIQIIAKSDGLIWDSSKDYGLKDLNDSMPIANNIWYNNADGSPVYYDQEIVRSLISYGSKQIDHINTKDQSVFNLVKVDSRAYQDAQASEDKAGKMYETFKSLSIGEIRQGEKGFYVFTQEVIEQNEGGEVTTMNYDWVYYLEPVDNKMLVVNFI